MGKDRFFAGVEIPMHQELVVTRSFAGVLQMVKVLMT
jgi:hypothetical protein